MRTVSPSGGCDDARLACAGAMVLFAFGAGAWLLRGGEPSRAPVLPPYRVDLNAASAGEIESLPGVGPVLAGRIVAERSCGPFARLEDLSRVEGIGPATLERLRPFVLCGANR